MNYINKFGESSIKNNLDSSSRLRTYKQNLQINNITKDMQQIYTTIKIFKEQFRNDNVDFSNKIEKKLNEIEELKNEYASQINIIRSDIKILQASITKDIDKDVELIEKAVSNQIHFANKDFIKNIEGRFNKIEDFLFKRIDSNVNVDEVKKRKLEYLKIKAAK